jgi:hypothetical protein
LYLNISYFVGHSNLRPRAGPKKVAEHKKNEKDTRFHHHHHHHVHTGERVRGDGEEEQEAATGAQTTYI